MTEAHAQRWADEFDRDQSEQILAELRPRIQEMQNSGQMMSISWGSMMQTQSHPGMIQALLLRLAARYIWWKKPDEAARYPDRIIAQVMKTGDFDDVVSLVAAVGEDRLRKVVRHAEAGQFDERSWTYWHYRLGLAKLEQVPPLPARRFQ